MPQVKKRKHVRKDIGGASRLVIDCLEPAPTIMAGGVGSVNTAQYTIGNIMPQVKKKQQVGETVSVGDSVKEKPPYRVPTMVEVTALPWNGLTVASTFSGCGGSSLGYRMAGFRVLWASEFVEAAVDSYRANMSVDTILDDRDIREVEVKDVLKATGLKVGQLDLFDGSPPCDSFSTAGKRQAGWGEVRNHSGRKQRTDDLFFEFVRLVDGIRPRTFVAENVSGLVKGTAKGYFLEVLKRLKGCGYRVACRVLDAQWLGVPQQRQRTIFIGVREDLKDKKGDPIMPCHPSPLPWRYSVREAIPWIASAEEDTGGEWGKGDVTDGQAPTVRAFGVGHLKAVRKAKGFNGEEWVAPSEPYSTVGASPAAGCNINSNGGKIEVESAEGVVSRRKFSIAELKRICAFPDDFILTGSYSQQWARLGMSVPPVMMFWIARMVRDMIFYKVDGKQLWKHDPLCLIKGTEKDRS